VQAKSLDREESKRLKCDNVSSVKYRNLDISGIYQLPHTGRKGLENTQYKCTYLYLLIVYVVYECLCMVCVNFLASTHLLTEIGRLMLGRGSLQLKPEEAAVFVIL
jgi:hypothetical protein